MKHPRTLLIAVVAVLVALFSPSAALVAGAAVAPVLSTVTLSASDVLGGTLVTGTATLTSAAPVGGTVVALSSDNPVAATVPASVTVLAGATKATFPVTTLTVPFAQQSLIIGTAGGVTAYSILTVRLVTQSPTGFISIIPGNNGSGTITSSPAGVKCTIVAGNGSGACTAEFAAGTVVRLTATAASGSKFQGWRGTPGCGDPSRITVALGSNITCQPAFSLK